MTDQDQAPTEQPARSAEEEAEQGSFMAKHWLRIAVVSILGTLLFAVALLQATGLVDFMSPVVETEGGQWLVIGVLALAVVAIGLWSWWSV